MLPYSKRVECTSGMLRPSFQRRMPPIAIARFGGSLMPVTYCIPLIRWTSKSPATPVPYSFQQRQRANIRGSNARLGTLPCQVSQSRVEEKGQEEDIPIPPVHCLPPVPSSSIQIR